MRKRAQGFIVNNDMVVFLCVTARGGVGICYKGVCSSVRVFYKVYYFEGEHGSIGNCRCLRWECKQEIWGSHKVMEGREGRISMSIGRRWKEVYISRFMAT